LAGRTLKDDRTGRKEKKRPRTIKPRMNRYLERPEKEVAKTENKIKTRLRKVGRPETYK